MSAQMNAHTSEAALLTSAVENVFRRLIRILVGKISLVKLQEIIRYVYVEEAEKCLKRENPGRNVPMTKMALVTGLDTRTLIQIRKRLESGEQRYKQQLLADLTPESAIVEAWANRIENSANGESERVLDYGSYDSEFEKLVRSTISTRGITTKSIIQRLVNTQSVEQNKEKRQLKLIVDQYSPYLSHDEPNILNAAFSALSNLISTIEHNISPTRPEKFFQRQSWTFRLNPEERSAFRNCMRELLEGFENHARSDIVPWENQEYSKNLITAGVGFYYFEE